MIDLGYGFIAVGADVVALGDYTKDIVKGFYSLATGQ